MSVSLAALLAIMGGVSAASNVGTAALNYVSQKKTNEANIAMMREQNDFNAAQNTLAYEREKQLRSTQYQVGVADMKAAGINPMLAFGSASAGTPSVNSAQAGNGINLTAPQFSNVISQVVRDVTNTAVAGMMTGSYMQHSGTHFGFGK